MNVYNILFDSIYRECVVARSYAEAEELFRKVRKQQVGLSWTTINSITLHAENVIYQEMKDAPDA